MNHLSVLSLIFLTTTLGLGAGVPPNSTTIDIQTTIFKVTDPAILLSMLKPSADGDEALFAQLVAMLKDGTAELVSDDHLSALPGKVAGVKATKEQPFPTEFLPADGPEELIPSSFEYKDCGTGTTAKFAITPSSTPLLTNPMLSGIFEVTNIRGDQLIPWPLSLPSQAADGHIDLLHFHIIASTAPFRYQDGAHHLLSAIQYIGETNGKDWSYCLTFAKAKVRSGEKTKPVPATSPLLRIHALSFQLGLASGKELLQERDAQGDRWLMEKLLAAVMAGTAQVKQQFIGHVDPQVIYHIMDDEDPFAPPAMVATTPDGTPLPTEKEEDQPYPFSSMRVGGSSTLEAIQEFCYPTEYSENLLPLSFEYKNLGHSFRATAVPSSAPGLTAVSVELQYSPEPVLRAFPASSVLRSPKCHQPAFSTVRFSTTIGVRSGGVYLLGAISLPDYYNENAAADPQMEISVMQVTGASSPPLGQQSRVEPELQCQLVSCDKNDAFALAGLQDSPASADSFLEESIQSGRARILAFCLLPNPFSRGAGISALTELPAPTRAHWTQNHVLLPTHFEFFTAGLSLDRTRVDSSSAGPTFCVNPAPRFLRIDTEAILAAANSDGLVAEPVDHFIESTDFPTTPGLRISAPELIKVPAGHPEQGRWQVTIVRRR